MTLENAKNYLRDRGMSTCSCKYGSQESLIEHVIKLKKLESEKTHN